MQWSFCEASAPGSSGVFMVSSPGALAKGVPCPSVNARLRNGYIAGGRLDLGRAKGLLATE